MDLAYGMISCRFVIDVENKRNNDQLHLLFWRNKLIEENMYDCFYFRLRWLGELCAKLVSGNLVTVCKVTILELKLRRFEASYSAGNTISLHIVCLL